MVSIEERLNYTDRINNNPKVSAFYNLLYNKKNIQSQLQNLNEIEEIFFGVVNAIQVDNKSEFEKHYNKKNKSKPNKDSPSPFVNDDFLILSLIIGIVRFEIDRSWIKYIISIRSKNSITLTFENILKANYYSTNNLPEIVFTFLKLTNQKILITNDFINFAYQMITDNTKLFESRSDFQILCSIRVYDDILLLKEAPDKSRYNSLVEFNERFIKRTKFISWAIQIILFACFTYLLIRIPIYGPKIIIIFDQYNYMFTIFGALGFSLIGNYIPFFRNQCQLIIMKILGYPNPLSKEIGEGK
jgi:hypothetical protein